MGWDLICLDEAQCIELKEYWENTMFKKISFMHPDYLPDGTITENAIRQIEALKTQKCLCVDRNIFGMLLSVMKKGEFSGENGKLVAALSIWTEILRIGISPFDAILEQVTERGYKQGLQAGGKELSLFNALYDTVPFKDIARAFFDDTVRFAPISFQEVNAETKFDFYDGSADFFFLYAAMLHFDYVLLSGSNPHIQFREYFNWYFKKCLVSVYALVYVVMYFAHIGICPPHHHTDTDADKVLAGCKNEAYDLKSIADIDPKRYDKDTYTLIFASCDKGIRHIFATTNDERLKNASSLEEYFTVLCKSLFKTNASDYIQCLMSAYSGHIPISATVDNTEHLVKYAQNLVKEEEEMLKSLIRSRHRTP